MKSLEEMKRLERVLEGPLLPKAKSEWGGADVVLTRKAPSKSTETGFSPTPRHVVTAYALELSWLFEELRDAFYAEQRLDGCSKIEFFGRLANAANRCIKKAGNPSPNTLCAAVLHEAFVIYDEMEAGEFKCMAIAVGNEIVDDYIDEAVRTGYIGTENTLAFFRSRGIEVENV